jgi:hypothetical protein
LRGNLPVELPAGIANLATGLTNMNRDALTLEKEKKKFFLRFVLT